MYATKGTLRAGLKIRPRSAPVLGRSQVMTPGALRGLWPAPPKRLFRQALRFAAVVALGLGSHSSVLALSGDLQGLNKSLSTNWSPASAWSGGNLRGWQELDYVVGRAKLSGAPRSNQLVSLSFPRLKNGRPGFENLYFLSNSPNLFFTAPPVLDSSAATADGRYTMRVTITNRQPGYVYFYARLAAGAHLNTGSSLQLRGSPALSPLQIHKPEAGPDRPDLALLKTGPATAEPGEVIRYTLSYTNQGTRTQDVARGVQLVDELPALVTFVSASNGGSNEGGLLTWDLPDLPIGASGFVTYQARVLTNAFHGQVFTNNAHLFEAGEDANPADNHSSVKTTVFARRPPVANPDDYTVNEDDLLTVPAAGVLANDTDPDPGTTLTAVLISGVSHGLLNLSANGAFTYRPATNFHGVDQFLYQASDGSNLSAVVSVTITVVPGDDPPVAVDDSYTMAEDTVLPVSAPGVLANDSDADGDTLATVLVSNPVHGSLALQSTGAFLYTPDSNYTGTDSFSYRASDGRLNSAVAMVTILITNVNDAPVARDDAYTTPAETLLTMLAPGVLANDSDVEGDPLTAALVSNPWHGTVTLNANGSFAYQPATNFSGLDTFTYRASDGGATSGGATVTITVVPSNLVILLPPVNLTNCPGDTAFFSVTALGTALTYQWSFGTNRLNDQTNHTLVLTNVTAADAGFYSVVVSGMAGGPSTNTALLVVNQNVLVVTPPANQVACPGDTVNFNLSATGAGLAYQWSHGAVLLLEQTNSGLTLSNVTAGEAGLYRIVVSGSCGPPVTNGATLTVNAAVAVFAPPVNQTNFVGGTAVFSVGATGPGLGYQWIFRGALVGTSSTLELSNLTTNQAGPYCVTVSGACGGPLTHCATLTIPNRAPTASPDAYTMAEDALLNIPAAGVLGNDSDPDGDTLSAELVGQPAQGALTLNPDGSFNYRPVTNYTGSDSFTYRASDGRAFSGLATVTITITNVNDAPVAWDDAYTMGEDTLLTMPAPGVLGNDFDADGDSLSTVLVASPAHGLLTIEADGSFSYQPATNYHGLDAFTYKASDGSARSGLATVTITITNGNDAPVVANDAYEMAEDTLLTLAAPGVLGNDSDVDGDPLSAVLVSHPTHGVLVLDAAGSLTYQPGTNFHGLDTFTYQASDGGATSGWAMVTITVTNVNDAPVAVDDAYVTAEDLHLIVPALGVLENDFDVEGHPLSALLVSGPAHGVLKLNVSGSFSYMPETNYHGLDSFTYWAADDFATSRVATVRLTITNVNDVPEAVDDAYTMAEDTLLLVGVPGVLANDLDLEGVPLHAQMVASPSHGTLTLNLDGSFHYQPATNFHGLDAFTYRASDGFATSEVATVTITITNINDAPVAVDDVYTMAEDELLIVAAPGVLTNDFDLDGDEFSAFTVDEPAHGLLKLHSDGLFSYEPETNYTGLDTFTYVVTDGVATSGLATVTITITPGNDAPVAWDDAYATAEETLLVIPAAGVLTNDLDADGLALSAWLASEPAHGALTFNANGSFSYQPATNYTGLDSFTYRATDGSATSEVATVTITITNLNDAPVARDDAYTMAEDTSLVVSAPGLLGNDFDVEGDALAAVLVTNPTHGALTLNADGSFNYHPAENFTGLDSYTYQATDGTATSGVATVLITITNVTEAPVAAPDAYAMGEDTVLSVAAPGVLVNDLDADGDVLSAVRGTNPAHGTLTFNANGSFSYQPTTNYHGLDSFTYRATDGSATSALTMVTITITPDNDAPVANDDEYTMLEDTVLTMVAPGVTANDLEPDGETLTSMLVGAPAHGTVVLSTNGSFVYVPATNFHGTDTFTYQLSDGLLESGLATVTIHVTPFNEPPVVSIVHPTNGSTFLSPAQFTVVAEAADLDGTVTNVQVFLGTNLIGTFTNAPYFVPLTNISAGTYAFHATATDDGGQSATSSVVSVTVTTTPPVTALGPIALNRQNGLFEQFVRISNPTPEDFPNGMRLFVSLGLDTTNKVWNATGTNALGVRYIDTSIPLLAGGHLDVLVQYYVPNTRVVPSPVLTAAPLPPSAAKFSLSSRLAPPVRVTRITLLPLGAQMEFTTTPQGLYFLQCSEDLVHWTTMPGLIHGTGGPVQCQDTASVAKRFYRVIKLP